MDFNSDTGPFNTIRRCQGSFVKVIENFESFNRLEESLPPLPSPSFRMPPIPPMGERMLGFRDKLHGFTFPGLGDNTSSGYDSASSSSSLFHHHSVNTTPSFAHLSAFPSSPPVAPVSPSGSLLRRALNEKPSRVKYLKESVTKILDQIDTRVGFLRETALELEEEKKKLVGVLTELKSTQDLSLISEVDKEEIFVSADCLLQRLQSVDVIVTTPRNEEQKKSLDSVNDFIERLVALHESNPRRGAELCQIYINTCSPDCYNLAVDDKFQRVVIACTAEDQKKIRKRLEALKRTFDHSSSNF